MVGFPPRREHWHHHWLANLMFLAQQILQPSSRRPESDVGLRRRSLERPALAATPLQSCAVEQRDERIIVETDRHRITGLLRLPVDGYRSRLTDYLNSSERLFLALTDVEVTTLAGNPRVERRDFVALSVRHIVLAMPAGDEPSGADED